MRILLAYESLVNFAGSELYLISVAEQLQALGHETYVHARELGPAADLAGERGLEVVGEGELPDACDALLTQDAELAYALAGRYPRASRIFVCHSTEYRAQAPPLAGGTCAAAVALNDRVEAHLRASPGLTVRRLRQPVDALRLARLPQPRRERPRVVVFGHDHAGEQLRRIERVCGDLGLELRRAGGAGNTTPGPEGALAAADVAIGIGRCVIEAMAARRAAYVSGVVGTDGWVTPESYAALEADGFSGRATDGVLTDERLARDLAAWRPELGEQGKDLAFANHDCATHARELVELWRELGAAVEEPPSETVELARLARVAARQEQAALEHATEAAVQRAKAERIARDKTAEILAHHERTEELARELGAVRATRRYRLAGALGRPLDAMRRLTGRGPGHD
jgi:hypothetical protein